MTTPRALPNNCIDARDTAAELVQEALVMLNPYKPEPLDHSKKVTIGLRLSDALRWLESIGATTKPEHIERLERRN